MSSPSTAPLPPRPAPGEDGDHPTYCRICEALCGLVVSVKDGKAVKIGPDRQNPHSQGHICVKGAAIAEVTYDRDRIIRPLKRTGGPGVFTPVTWEEALDDIAGRLGAILGESGPQSFASYCGNPASYGNSTLLAPGLFHAAVGGGKTFSPQTEDTASVLLAHRLLFGHTSFVYPDLPNCDYLLVFGSNPVVSHGSLIGAPRIRHDFDEIARRGRVVIIDPRRTETAKCYDHLPIRPDSDVWLLAAMIALLFDRNLADTEFLQAHVDGWEALRAAVAPVTPRLAARKTGIDEETITQLTLDFARHGRAAAMGRTGICRGSFATLSNLLLLMLNIVAGKFHRLGGTGFGHGAADVGEMLAHGGMADYHPGRSRVSGLPEVFGSLPSVTLASEITEAGEGRIRALFVVGGNPVMSIPGGDALAKAFDRLDLMVSFDIYMTETSKHADYILPGRTFIERDDVPIIQLGYMVRPFVQYARACVSPPGEVRDEFDVYRDIATRLGAGAYFARTPHELVDEMLRTGPEGTAAGPEAMGISLDRLAGHPHGLMVERGRWAFEMRDKIRHADGRIHAWSDPVAAEMARLLELRDEPDRSFRLFSSRKLKSINSWFHNVEKLVRSDEPALLVNDIDAEAEGLADDDHVELSSDWGRVIVRVRTTPDVIRGGVTYPHGWGHAAGWQVANGKPGVNINAIAPATFDAVEQLTGMSFLDGFPVRIRKLQPDETAG